MAAPVRKRERGPSAFSRFVNSGWGVAIICALVAVSVMGGIIWAGFNAGDVPPGYNDAITGEVYLTAGLQSVEPEAFFGYSEVYKGNQSAMSCGAGFYGEFTVSPVPTLTYADDLRLHMPKNYTLEAVYVYDPDAPTEAIYTFESVGDLKTLTAGSYYVALRITHTEGKNEYGYDYAFCLNVNVYETETPIALDLTFYTEDNRYTDGWERMRLFWQDLYILDGLDGEETTGGLEIVTEAVGPEDIVSE